MKLIAVFSLFMGFLFLSVSSLGLVARIKLKGLVANVLAFALVSYATIVLLTQVLSELQAVHRLGFLVGHLLITALTLPWAVKLGWPCLATFWQAHFGRAIPLQRWSVQYPALVTLGFFIVVSMLFGAFLILAVPPNTPDSLWYHLSRAAHWLQNGTLHHFQTADLQKIAFAINAEIGLLWLMALWGTDQLTGLVQWLMTSLTMVTIYGLARRLRFPRAASIFAAFLWSTLTIVVAQTTSTKNDITVAFLTAVSFYFLLRGLNDDENQLANLSLFGTAFGLALGTKTTAWLLGPGLGLLAVALILADHRQYLPKFIYAGLLGLVGFGLFGAYNYLLNWLNYGSPFGPPALVEEHGLGVISWVTFWSNLGRVGYDFFNPGGLPTAIVDYVQSWRPAAGERLFALLNIEANPPEMNWTGSLFTFDDSRQVRVADDTGWYGPLGSLLFLPLLFIYAFKNPFSKQYMWRWLTALVVLSFFIALAVFIRWRPYTGRFLLIPVVIGAPLMAGFYTWSETHKTVRWLVVAIAIVVLSWSALNNFDRPIWGAENILTMDYYRQRVIRRQFLAPAYEYIDNNLLPTARLGVTGDGFITRWDYPFFGRDLRRNVIHLTPMPEQIDDALFRSYDLDYLLLALDEPDQTVSVAPLWPILLNTKESWFLVKRTEVEIFSRSDGYEAAFGDDYQAYLTIKSTLEQEPEPVRALTTDPKMYYYQRDDRFVFDIPDNLGDLQGVTHIIMAPWWTPTDYQRLGVSIEETQRFLTQEQFVDKLLEVNGYVLYRIIPWEG